MRAPTMALRARTGCDLQRIDDVTDAIRDFGDRYLDRVYTPAEQATYRTGGAASLAARFAAKEAVLKLIGSADGVDPRSVEITQQDGRPVVRLTGLAATLAARAGFLAAQTFQLGSLVRIEVPSFGGGLGLGHEPMVKGPGRTGLTHPR